MSTTTPNRERSGSQREVPQPIVDTLERLARRIRRVILLRGLLAVMAVVLVTLLVLVSVETVFAIFSTTTRWLIAAAALGLVLLSVLLFVVRPLLRRLRLTSIARMVEEHHPELQERISSAFELLSHQGSSDRVSDGSQQLIDALAKEAIADVRAVDPKKEVTARTVKPYLWTAVAAMVVFIAVFLRWPDQVKTALARSLVPTANMGNASALDLAVHPGDLVIPIGDSLSIQVTGPIGSLRRVELFHEDSTHHVTKPRMRAIEGPADQDQAIYEIDTVVESFRYRVRAGSAVTKYYQVKAVARPAVDSLKVSYEFPAYTQLPSLVIDDPAVPIMAPPATQVTLRVAANKSVAHPILSLGGEDLQGIEELVGEQVTYRWMFEMVPEMETVASLVLTDDYGFESESIDMEVRAIEDRRPTVEITEPTVAMITLKPDDRITLHYAASEDFGLTSVELLVEFDENRTQVIASEIPSLPQPPLPGRSQWLRGQVPLDLAALSRDGINQFQVRVRVRDDRPESLGGSQQGVSEALTISIAEDAEEYAAQKIEQQTEDFQSAVRSALENLKQAAAETNKLKRWYGRSGPATERMRAAAERVSDQIDQSASELNEIAKRFDDTLFDPLVPQLKEIASEKVMPAKEQVDLLPLSEEASQRKNHVEQGRQSLNAAINELEKLLGETDTHRDALDRLAQIEALAAQQQRLAEQAAQNAHAADQGSPPQAEQATAEHEAWQAEEEEVRDSINELVDDDSETPMDATPRDESPQPGALAAEVRELAEAQKFVREALDRLQQPEVDREELRDEVRDRMQEPGEGAAAEEKSAEELLSDLQQEIADKASDLAAASKQLEEQYASAPQESSQQQSREAQQQLSKAQQQAAQAAQQLGAQQPSPMGQTPQDQPGQDQESSNPAQEAQDQAAQALEQAAESLSQLSQQPKAEQSPLEQASEQASEAASSPSPSGAKMPAEAAAQALAQAAQAAAQQAAVPSIGEAQAPMPGQPGQQGEPGQQGPPGQGKPGQGKPGQGKPGQGKPQPGEGEPGRGQPMGPPTRGAQETGAAGALGRAGEETIDGRVGGDWASFKGDLRSDVVEGATSDTPADYRDLVNRYFRELSRMSRSGTSPSRNEQREE